MTRAEKYLVAIIVFLLVLLTGLTAGYVYLVIEDRQHPAVTVDPNPACHLLPVPKEIRP